MTVWVPTADRLRLAARRWSASRPTGTSVVLVHGFTASKDHPEVVTVAEDLVGAGYDVLAYDARGHGASEGRCTLGYLEQLDVAAAVSHAGGDADRVVVMGASMGAVAVLRWAAERAATGDADGLVVVSSPARWKVSPTPQVALASAITQTRVGRWVARRYLGVQLVDRWIPSEPPIKLAARIKLPLAIVHGRRDRFIRHSEAELLYTRAAGPRRIDLVAGMGHAYHAGGRAALLDAVTWVLDQAPAASPGDEATVSLDQLSRSSTSLAR